MSRRLSYLKTYLKYLYSIIIMNLCPNKSYLWNNILRIYQGTVVIVCTNKILPFEKKKKTGQLWVELEHWGSVQTDLTLHCVL